jgi:hypothetical protein
MLLMQSTQTTGCRTNKEEVVITSHAVSHENGVPAEVA